jgi:hypothetical protein
MVRMSTYDENGGCGCGEFDALQPIFDSHGLFGCNHILGVRYRINKKRKGMKNKAREKK